MTDTTVAPPSSAPSAPSAPSAASEVTINQNPVNSQNPVGPQAPSADVEVKGSTHRTPSRREAIQAAFERANNPRPKDAKPAQRAPQEAPKAAEAKPGHNQPPEETPRLDLKKRPDQQPNETVSQAQPRDRGRFAPRQQPEDRTNATPAETQREQSQHKRLPPHAPYAEPLPRMAEVAKRDWHATPETVRGDIHRMHSEFSKAAQQYQRVAEAYRPLEPFDRMAREGGTTLHAAISNYTSMEQKLISDPIAGLDLIVHNLGLKAPDGRPLNLRDIAYHVLSSSPEQLRQVQQGNAQNAAQQQIGALHRKLDALERRDAQRQYAQQFQHTRSAVDQFAATHPRLDELGVPIERELRLGFDLETAYRRAELLYPATRAAQTGTTSAQTRTPDKSIHGAPDVAPSNGASVKPKKASPTARAAVQNAIARMNGTH
jgi:hypothetical protein